jgi:7-alpha-hydroxysteroid dehydrogenase
MLEQFLLTDQVAIVTGAGRGIGAAIATTFAEAGADVVIVSRTAEQLDEVADGVRAHGRRVLAIPGDVNDLDFLATVVARTVDELGRLDILVNNAGGSPTKGTLDTEVAEVESSFHFNVSVPLELSRLVAPHMLAGKANGRNGGAIINIGSVAGKHANRATLTHSLTKAAIAQLTRLTAADFSPRIRVNAVLPGAIETAALVRWLDSKGDDARAAMVANTPMRRNGTPDDIAAAVLFLASPAASWITGKLLEVDGGAVASVLPSQIPDL